MQMDHLVWGAADLEAAAADLADATGVQAAAGGRHEGRGTHNRLLSLGTRSYLEIMAPDPSQDRATLFRPWLRTLTRPGLVTWAIAADDLEAMAARAAAAGLSPQPMVSMSRRRPDGALARWRLLYLDGHAFGTLLPFFIDWGTTAHPCETLPAACRLKAVQLEHPEAASLRGLLSALAIDAAVARSSAPGLRAELETPRGPVSLSSALPFPSRW